MPLDVRRLAAVDMHGARGTLRRRRLILGEFVLGAVGGTALGILVVVSTTSLAWQIFGFWLIGVCLNYVPLALHARSFRRWDGLDAELAGVDIERELRRYTKAQLWIAVPLLFVVLAGLRQPRHDVVN